jgi:hypothetical protein
MFMDVLHRRHQTNTFKSRQALTFHYLGWRGFVDKRFILLCEQNESAVINQNIIVDNFNC